MNKIITYFICLGLLVFSFSSVASATLNNSVGIKEIGANDIDLSQRQSRTRWLVGGYVLATALYGYSSWWGKDVEKHRFTEDGQLYTETVSNRTSTFRVNNEGWFEEETPNGGADKFGHAFSFYVSTRLMTKGFQWAGYDHTTAAKMAGITSGAVSLAVEVLDGYTVEYGFSKEDLVMNLAGISFATWLELEPEWDDVFDFRFKYWRSDDAKRLGETDPVSDYSGQTYLLITKASGFKSLRDNPWLRYLELAVGYGSRGYQPNPGKYEDTQPKKRFLYYGLSINLSQILTDTVFRHNTTPSNTQKITTGVLEYLQMPGTALLFDYKF